MHVLMAQIKPESQLPELSIALVNALVPQPWSCRGICDLLWDHEFWVWQGCITGSLGLIPASEQEPQWLFGPGLMSQTVPDHPCLAAGSL